MNVSNLENMDVTSSESKLKGSDKILRLVKEIQNLNLAEGMMLANELKTALGIPDSALMGAAPAAAGGEAKGAVEDAAPEKSEFNVVIQSAGEKKTEVIKAVKELASLSLKAAKDLVDSGTFTLAEAVSKEQANKMKTTLEAAGAKVNLE